MRVRGVEIGSIRSIYNRDHKTFVVIETHDPVRLHKNYNITVTAKGLMGDRFLAIDPGDTNTELIDKKEVLNGNFQLGPTEAVAYAEQLRSEISRLTALIKEFKYGTAGSPSFISRFNGAMDDFDSLSVSVITFSMGLDENLNKSLDSLSDFLKQTLSLTDNLSQSVPGMVTDLKKLITKADIIVSKVDTLLTKSESMVAFFESPELENMGDFIEKVRVNLKSLREIIYDINKDGLKLPVRPW